MPNVHVSNDCRGMPMISRRTFMKIGTCSLSLPWWLQAKAGTSLASEKPSTFNMSVLEGNCSDAHALHARAFKTGLMRAFSNVVPAPPSISSLEHGHFGGLNDLSDQQRHGQGDMVIGLIPENRWKLTLLELTKRNMSMIWHGQHREDVGGESRCEHHITSAVCDSLSAQIFGGYLNDSKSEQWVIHVASPTSAKPLSSIIDQDVYRGRIKAAIAPSDAYYVDGNDAQECYACSWSDEVAINQPGIRKMIGTPVMQADANRLCVFRAHAHPMASGSESCGWIEALGFSVGLESLRAVRKDALRAVQALPSSDMTLGYPSSNKIRVDMFTGGRSRQQRSCRSMRAELISFVAMRRSNPCPVISENKNVPALA